jgi:hypothetical protein
MNANHTNFAILRSDLPTHIRSPFPRCNHPTLHDTLCAHGHRAQIRAAQRTTDVAAIQEARFRDCEECGGGEGIQQRRCAATVQVSTRIA